MNNPNMEGGKHYVTIFMLAAVADPDKEPTVMEPEKCEGKTGGDVYRVLLFGWTDREFTRVCLCTVVGGKSVFRLGATAMWLPARFFFF